MIIGCATVGAGQCAIPVFCEACGCEVVDGDRGVGFSRAKNIKAFGDCPLGILVQAVGGVGHGVCAACRTRAVADVVVGVTVLLADDGGSCASDLAVSLSP